MKQEVATIYKLTDMNMKTYGDTCGHWGNGIVHRGRETCVGQDGYTLYIPCVSGIARPYSRELPRI